MSENHYDPDKTACQCCPHITFRLLDIDPVYRQAWEYCDFDSPCLKDLCEDCQNERGTLVG